MKEAIKRSGWGVVLYQSGKGKFIVHSDAIPYPMLAESPESANAMFTAQVNLLKALSESTPTLQ
jgi:hypothetical protein